MTFGHHGFINGITEGDRLVFGITEGDLALKGRLAEAGVEGTRYCDLSRR
jgi:hypothetical protein